MLLSSQPLIALLAPQLLAEVPFGQYLAWYKLLPFVILFLVWIQLLLWVDKDTITARLPREPINAGLWALLVVALVAALLLPMFIVALAVFVVLFGISIGGYLGWRNTVVGLEDIPEQLGSWAKNVFRSKKARRYE